MTPIDIGMRAELFIDDYLIADMTGVTLKLHEPTKREVVLQLDRPYEGPVACYYNCFQDGGTIRMYYRGYMPVGPAGQQTRDDDTRQVTCLAESTDGIHFTRLEVGLFEFDGSTRNNIVWVGAEAHNFCVFRDDNPTTPPDARYKAVGNGWEHLYALASPDGMHWRRIQEEPIDARGKFDSLNVPMWDPLIGRYRLFSRDILKEHTPWLRLIQHAVSDDFLHWSAPESFRYAAEAPMEEFYTNAVAKCPGAEHIFLAFPKRFVAHRKKIADHPYSGLSDTVFMSSRDGVHWDRRFLEAWVRPDLDPKSWTDRTNMVAAGIIQTSPSEFSLYISEHYRYPTNCLRRLTVRRHGFASIHAGYAGGECVTKPLTFSGNRLILNYATSVAGSVQVGIEDEQGVPAPGFAANDMEPLFGNELDAIVSWKGGSDLSAIAGKPVRFRFILHDADLFCIRTANPELSR